MTQQGNGLGSALSRRTFLRNSAGAAGLAAAAAATTTGLGSGCDTVDDGWDDAADVVVMGAGGAGLVAAITAAEAGGEVLVIEKADIIGGTTALSGGQVQASGTPLQLAHVDDDTAARHAAWWLAASEGIADPEILALLADEAPYAVAFMENLGMTYSGLYGVGPMPPVSPDLYRDRIHIPDTGGSDVLAGGAHHVALLRARAEALGVRFQLEASVDGLYRHHHDEVVGVRMRRQLADDKRITWQIDEAPDAEFAVFDQRHILTHGDKARGGNGIGGVFMPIMRMVAKKQSRQAALGRPFDHLWLGHFHQGLHGPNWTCSGALIGADGYAMENNWLVGEPEQAAAIRARAARNPKTNA